MNFAINIHIFLQEIFLTKEGGGVGVFLIGVDNNFRMSPALGLIDVVELTNKVESLLSITFSSTIEESSYTLLSTINSFKSS